MVTYFGGTLWENRLLGFGMGMVSFGLLTYIFMGEGITLKNRSIINTRNIIGINSIILEMKSVNDVYEKCCKSATTYVDSHKEYYIPKW
jgi:hypothetical protein